jgi:hypothetical protein
MNTFMKATQQNLYNHVQFLTELRPYRNYRNLQSLQRVRDYIIREFQSYGLPTEEQTWVARGNEYANVIGVYNAHKSRRLIVGAHYDVCGDQPGADDNASAVAGLLETARMVAATQPDLDYRIDFVAYSLEEPPFYGTKDMGSYVHAKSLHDKKADVIGLINYEMIGYFSDEPHSQPYPSPALAKMYPHTANFIVVVGKNPTALTALKKIDDLTGLHTVKERIHELQKFNAINQLKKKKGIATPNVTMHLVFTGNPGTGKTTVARILGEVYHSIGLLDSGQTIMVNALDLLAKYVGQTAPKVEETFNHALGGVLFIDEA